MAKTDTKVAVPQSAGGQTVCIETPCSIVWRSRRELTESESATEISIETTETFRNFLTCDASVKRTVGREAMTVALGGARLRGRPEVHLQRCRGDRIRAPAVPRRRSGWPSALLPLHRWALRNCVPLYVCHVYLYRASIAFPH